MSSPTSPKPMPEVDEFHTAHECSKCGGTGFYCMGVENGRPYSRTGFRCYGCGGTGWKVTWKRGAKKAFWANVKPIVVIRDDHGNIIENINPNAS